MIRAILKDAADRLARGETVSRVMINRSTWSKIERECRIPAGSSGSIVLHIQDARGVVTDIEAALDRELPERWRFVELT